MISHWFLIGISLEKWYAVGVLLFDFLSQCNSLQLRYKQSPRDDTDIYRLLRPKNQSKGQIQTSVFQFHLLIPHNLIYQQHSIQGKVFWLVKFFSRSKGETRNVNFHSFPFLILSQHFWITRQLLYENHFAADFQSCLPKIKRCSNAIFEMVQENKLIDEVIEPSFSRFLGFVASWVCVLLNYGGMNNNRVRNCGFLNSVRKVGSSMILKPPRATKRSRGRSPPNWPRIAVEHYLYKTWWLPYTNSEFRQHRSAAMSLGFSLHFLIQISQSTWAVKIAIIPIFAVTAGETFDPQKSKFLSVLWIGTKNLVKLFEWKLKIK